MAELGGFWKLQRGHAQLSAMPTCPAPLKNDSDVTQRGSATPTLLAASTTIAVSSTSGFFPGAAATVALADAKAALGDF